MRLKLIITSDRILKYGTHLDKVGPLVKKELEGYEVDVEYLPNDLKLIKRAVMKALVEDYEIVRVVGGTGLSDRDKSVEAVKPLLEKELHLFPVDFFMMSDTPLASLGRPIAGRSLDSLVIVSPGSPDAAKVVIKRIKKAGEHIIKIIRYGVSGWDLNSSSKSRRGNQ